MLEAYAVKVGERAKGRDWFICFIFVVLGSFSLD